MQDGLDRASVDAMASRAFSRSPTVAKLVQAMQQVTRGTLELAVAAARTPQEALATDHRSLPRLCSCSQAGCPIERSYFKVLTCGAQVNGGFSLEHGVILCHNRLQTFRDVEHAMAHELVHAYDHCRVAVLDWTSCRQHACTEVRARAVACGLLLVACVRACTRASVRLRAFKRQPSLFA
jgi:hypothetical protein